MPPDCNINLSTSSLSSPGLLQFLKHARSHFLPTIRNGIATQSPIYVLGNQSADLDSIISAIIYSYFFSRNDNGRGGYIPLVNLSNVPSGSELRRLRPEFACALELSISSLSSTMSMQQKEKVNDRDDDENEDGIVKLLREHIITVADFQKGLLSSPEMGPREEKKKKILELDCVMVDWNNLPVKVRPDGETEAQGKGSVDGLSDLVTFTATGCIDHRPDEGFMPPLEQLPQGSQRVITPGPGSCTSLIVREIRQRGLWPVTSPSVTEGQGQQQQPQPAVDDEAGDQSEWEIPLAKLALASILIDTTNLTAEGKVTDIDRDAVSFLTERISSSSFSSSSSSTGRGGKEDGEKWDRAAFFEKIQYAKQHSLDWLTIDEILGRDYKDWTVSAPGGGNRVIGIASVVRPLKWTIAKARNEEDDIEESSAKIGRSRNGLDSFLDKLKFFAIQRHLDVVSVMTAFSTDDENDGGEGDRFARELLVWSLKDEYNDILANFADTAKEELGLQQWNEFPIEGSRHENSGVVYIWRQGNISQSRKQVAPLLRDAFMS